MIENKVVLVEMRRQSATGKVRGIMARRMSPPRLDSALLPVVTQSTVAVDNFVGKAAERAARGRKINALNNLPQV
jgi:hypothetical protein